MEKVPANNQYHSRSKKVSIPSTFLFFHIVHKGAVSHAVAAGRWVVAGEVPVALVVGA